jgi:MFS family permease
MAVSGLCAVLIGPLASSPAVLLVPLALVWGAAIVADSAQFSASVTEFADRGYVGTAVTVQTALGFLLTMVTIGMIPAWSASWGWRWAYAPLAIGPALGIACMWQLRALERRARRAELVPASE